MCTTIMKIQWNYEILIGCVKSNQKPRFYFYQFFNSCIVFFLPMVDSCSFSLSVSLGVLKVPSRFDFNKMELILEADTGGVCKKSST